MFSARCASRRPRKEEQTRAHEPLFAPVKRTFDQAIESISSDIIHAIESSKNRWKRVSDQQQQGLLLASVSSTATDKEPKAVLPSKDRLSESRDILNGVRVDSSKQKGTSSTKDSAEEERILIGEVRHAAGLVYLELWRFIRRRHCQIMACIFRDYIS